jgi:hypothetical protein
MKREGWVSSKMKSDNFVYLDLECYDNDIGVG